MPHSVAMPKDSHGAWRSRSGAVPLDAVTDVHDTEVEFGLAGQPEVGERRVVLVFVALDGHRDVDELDRAVDQLGSLVEDVDTCATVRRLPEVRML